MDCGRWVADVIGEAFHDGDGSYNSCIMAEEEAAQRAEDASDDIAWRLLELESEHDEWKTSGNVR